jgi:hypothetical protein
VKIKYPKGTYTNYSGVEVVVKCPECGQGGTFDKINECNDKLTNDRNFVLGNRVCPNPQCYCHIFFVYDFRNQKIITYPPLRINFDSTSIPKKIKESLSEAIGCESIEAYMASAIMIRRTLECLCEERIATGKTLKDRIKNLKSKIILPDELFEALENLRLLGNDAAHVESKDYENIGKDEVNVAIELTKEVLKASYQYENLLNKLKSFKKV